MKRVIRPRLSKNLGKNFQARNQHQTPFAWINRLLPRSEQATSVDASNAPVYASSY
ncbi:hypothetical protein SAMN02745857_01212 [Andreprevotia lacus DSM 23236]|jgi:hypothetical protein|uniref:Uncharacterized protein n=1 Tax=Andreprevotia lacus DSM 23236 TaxID=1121001 RepID=A0A1W1XD71_9NEIS|nr:hypothetical protein [Andreprevotia lacus]SMC21441.1 hypothetical protein SAMN02745857_01212 [Andreprevotia lacus DSM 23236]